MHHIEKTHRTWGTYSILSDYKTIKVKELVVNPGKCLSLQRHFKRNEFWVVREGVATIYHGDDSKTLQLSVLGENETIIIPKKHWHKLCNHSRSALSIIEVQYGEECIEEDIERAD